VIHDFLNPDFNLIGEFDDRSGSQLQACYTDIMENHPPVQRMSLENAELTKVALNTFVTTKITYANMLAELCFYIPGGDVDLVSNALGLDARIGRKYLTGGLGYGGPCFPRDNIALSYFARFVGCEASLAETTDRLNRSSSRKLAQTLCSIIKPGSTVAILGLAYKPYSHIVEESQGVYLARELAASGMRVIGYDPLGKDMARHELADKVVVLEDLNACLQQADSVVIATPDPEFRALQSADFPQKNPRVTVFDCWRILRKKMESATHVSYIPLGIGKNDEANSARLRQLWDNH
jgi:UDPglucose 6-dehydrogenase